MGSTKKIRKTEQKSHGIEVNLSALPEAEVSTLIQFRVSCILINSLVWLIIGSFFYILSAISILYPEFSGKHEYLTYGRLHGSFMVALIYGFLIQGLSGIIYFSSYKHNGNISEDRFRFYSGCILWNSGVFTGLIGCLLGYNSGHVYFEIPHFSLLILLFASLFIVYDIIIINKDSPFISMKICHIIFSISLILCFLIAFFFIIRFPVTGAGQIIIYHWLKNILFNVCIAGVIIGIILYSLSTTDRPSSLVTYFVFSSLLLFGGAGGITPSMPVPRWIYELNRSLALFICIPVFVFLTYVLISMRKSISTTDSKSFNVKSLFYSAAGIAFYFACHISTSIVPINQLTEFTYFEYGKDFFLLLAAAIPIIFTAEEVILRDFFKCNFSLTIKRLQNLIYTTVFMIPTACIIAGILQGCRIFDYRILFTDVISVIYPFYYFLAICFAVLFIFSLLAFLNFNIEYAKVILKKARELKVTYLTEYDYKKSTTS